MLPTHKAITVEEAKLRECSYQPIECSSCGKQFNQIWLFQIHVMPEPHCGEWYQGSAPNPYPKSTKKAR